MARFVNALAGLLLFFGLATSAGAQEANWLHDYAAGRQEAKQKRRPLLLDFGTSNCIWCRRLDMTSFRDPVVVQALQEKFVAAKVDAERETAVAQSFGVEIFPTLVFTDADGRVLFRQVGYVDAAGMKRLLERALRDCGAEAEEKPARPAVMVRRTVPMSESVSAANPAAAKLLAQAKEEQSGGHVLSCLLSCRRLAAEFPGTTEAAEATQLANGLMADRDKAKKAFAGLTEVWGEMALAQADRAAQEGRQQEAIALLERVVQTCQGTANSVEALNRLSKLRP